MGSVALSTAVGTLMGVRRLGLVLVCCAMCASVAGVRVAAASAAPEPDRPAMRLTLGDDGRIRIGKVGPLPYDGRAGVVLAGAVDAGTGRLEVHAEPGDASLAPVKLVPRLPFVLLAVDVEVHALDGEIDLCTGATRVDLDATLRPNFASHAQTQVSAELTGTAPMDAYGNVRMAASADAAATANPLVDAVLGLPGPVELDLPVHFDLPHGSPLRCPSTPPPPNAAPARMVVLPGSRLLISRFPPFAYDGKGSGGTGTALEVSPGRYEVAFDGADLSIPPVRFIPGIDAIRVEILTNGISGTVDTGTGDVDFAFDAVFQPVVGTFRPSAISVVTDLTTGTSSGYFQTLTGDPMDRWGDVHLVGIAKVPKTGDLLVDWLLSLPTDAVADLRVHLDLPASQPDARNSNT